GETRESERSQEGVGNVQAEADVSAMHNQRNVGGTINETHNNEATGKLATWGLIGLGLVLAAGTSAAVVGPRMLGLAAHVLFRAWRSAAAA
ncbi:MAG TPA: hypothetical protein P5572_14415, partial [Phycisphaerae bacterium]|nr:hypothetical protein [Phycisphaerae bacterium]